FGSEQDARAVAPVGLGLIERPIGPVDAFVYRLLVEVVEGGQSGRKAHVQSQLTVHQGVLCQALTHAFDAQLCLFRGGVHQDQQELFAAPSGEHIDLADGQASLTGKVAQHFVAHAVAVRVVDLLEEVEVQQGDGKRVVPGTFQARLVLGQHFDDVAAVDQAREGVSGSEDLYALERLLQLLLLRLQAPVQAVELSRQGGNGGYDGHHQDEVGPLQLPGVRSEE